jgi:hypothetical protein
MVRSGSIVTSSSTLSRALLAGVLLMAGIPAYANLSFTATYLSSITSSPDAAAIEGDIQSVLSMYSSNIFNNINVSIDFGTMNSGLGESSFSFDTVPYQTYCTDLAASATSASDATATANLGACGAKNPVNGTTSIELKYANANAVGINDAPPGGSDGTILINTSITDGGTGNCTGDCYSFQATLEHELDEILGLGSALANTSGGNVAVFSDNPAAEDLFRFSAPGVRSFNAGVSCGSLGSAYFSIDGGTTNLAGFNNACNGGDFGDWDTSSVRVQNYQAGPGQNPALGVELTALDVIGYTLDSTTPEPPTFLLTATTLGAIAFLRRRIAARQAQAR